MASGDSVSAKLAGAKAELNKANKSFPSSPAPAHEYSNAPYSLVSDVKKKLQAPIDAYHKTVKDVEAPGVAQGVENRQKQMQEANK